MSKDDIDYPSVLLSPIYVQKTPLEMDIKYSESGLYVSPPAGLIRLV